MSTVFESATTRHPSRWFHLPSFAILAVAGTGAYATDRVVDAWSASQPSARQETRDAAARVVSVRGTAERRGLVPTRVTWDVHLTAHGRTSETARRELMSQRELLYVALAEAGVPDESVRLLDPIVDEETRTITRTLADGSTTEQSVTTGYEGVQVVRVESSDIAASVKSYEQARRSRSPVLGGLTEPRCVLDAGTQLERELQREAQADLRGRAEELVRTLGYGRLDALTGLDLGRLSLNEGPSPCSAWHAVFEVSAVYRLR